MATTEKNKQSHSNDRSGSQGSAKNGATDGGASGREGRTDQSKKGTAQAPRKPQAASKAARR